MTHLQLFLKMKYAGHVQNVPVLKMWTTTIFYFCLARAFAIYGINWPSAKEPKEKSIKAMSKSQRLKYGKN